MESERRSEETKRGTMFSDGGEAGSSETTADSRESVLISVRACDAVGSDGEGEGEGVSGPTLAGSSGEIAEGAGAEGEAG